MGLGTAAAVETAATAAPPPLRATGVGCVFLHVFCACVLGYVRVVCARIFNSGSDSGRVRRVLGDARAMRKSVDDFSVVCAFRVALECVLAWCLVRCPGTRLCPDSNMYMLYGETLCYGSRKYKCTVQEHQWGGSEELVCRRKFGFDTFRHFLA